MQLQEILTELENHALEDEELKSSAGALQASILFFFEQVETRKTWSLEQLLNLRETSQVAKSLELVEAALQATEESEPEESE